MSRTACSLWAGLLGAALATAFPMQGRGAVAPQVSTDTAQPAAGNFTVEENVPYATISGSRLHLDVYEPAPKGSAIVHGTQDGNVPIAQAQELFERLQAAGVPVAFIKVEDTHTFRTPEARRQLALETLAFFHCNLSPASK